MKDSHKVSMMKFQLLIKVAIPVVIAVTIIRTIIQVINTNTAITILLNI